MPEEDALSIWAHGQALACAATGERQVSSAPPHSTASRRGNFPTVSRFDMASMISSHPMFEQQIAPGFPKRRAGRLPHSGNAG